MTVSPEVLQRSLIPPASSPSSPSNPVPAPPLYSLVEVVWNDAEAWMDPAGEVEDLPEVCRVRTYGHVIRVTPDSLFLAGEDAAGSPRAVTKIPKAIILEIHILERT